MGWLKTFMTDVKEAASVPPIECPRGWGDVSFNAKVEGFLPIISISRSCPIAGVEKCSSCRHPFNPQRAETLRDELTQLHTLVDDGLMTDAEYRVRRRMTLSFLQFGARIPGSTSATTAMLLVPLGLVTTGIGWWCGLRFHPAAWTAAAIGAVMLALGVSFAGISYWRRKEVDRWFDAEDHMGLR